MKIDSAELRETINGLLAEYGDKAREAIEESCKSVGKEAAKELKKGGGFGGTGKFNKGWTVQNEATRLGYTTIVYNKKLPGLAHLLEFGHAINGGGRTRSTDFNFIAPINDKVPDWFLEDFAKHMGG